MQNFAPEIKQLLTDWYFLTLDNPLYAGALMVSAWLLTVFFYSIRIYFLNKKQRAAEQANIKVQGMLDEAQQQKKQSDDSLTAITDKMAKDQQLATEFSFKVEQRNQQIVDNIKQLANKFDLSEQLVDSGEKQKAEFVWQQQDNIQVQLTERLQAEKLAKNSLQETYQQERELFTKQKALIEQLQNNLDLQTSKSTQLEQDLSAQRLIQQQQINEADQKLADKLADIQAKHEFEITSLTNEVNQQNTTVVVDTEDKIPVETDVLGEVFQEAISEATSQIKVSTFEPDVKDKIEDLAAKIEPEIVVKESIPEVLEPFVTEKPMEQEVSVPEQQTEVLKAKVSLAEEPDYTKSKLDISGKFKGLFGKDKKQADTTAVPEQQAEILAAHESVAEVEEEPDYTKSNLDISGKFKGLFGKDKKQADTTAVPGQQAEIPEPEQYDAEVSMTTSREPDLEEPEFEPDYTKSNFKLSGRVKKLFGKS